MNKMSLQKSIQNFGIKQALKYMEKDPEENIPKLMDMVCLLYTSPSPRD